MSNNDDTISILLGICGFVVGLIGVGYAIGSHKKLGDVADKLDMSITDLTDDLDIDIPQHVIDKAVNKAVEKEVEKQVRVVSKDAVSKISKNICEQVAISIDKSYSDIDRSVKSEIKKQIAFIDIREAREEVIDSAKEKVAEKFESDLDDILDRYKADLATVSKIYESIAKAVNETNEYTEDNVIRLIIS